MNVSNIFNIILNTCHITRLNKKPTGQPTISLVELYHNCRADMFPSDIGSPSATDRSATFGFNNTLSSIFPPFESLTVRFSPTSVLQSTGSAALCGLVPSHMSSAVVGLNGEPWETNIRLRSHDVIFSPNILLSLSAVPTIALILWPNFSATSSVTSSATRRYPATIKTSAIVFEIHGSRKEGKSIFE